MNYRTRIHLESLCVYLSMALIAWASVLLVRATNVAAGGWGSLVAMGALGILWTLVATAGSGLCRTTATMAAILVALSGASLEAEPMSQLLWQTDGQTRSFYLSQLVQLLVGAAGVVVLLDGIVILRAVWFANVPFWNRFHVTAPLLDEAAVAEAQEEAKQAKKPAKLTEKNDPILAQSFFVDTLFAGHVGECDSLGVLPNPNGLLRRRKDISPTVLASYALAFVAGLVLAGAVLFIVAKTPARAQILFSVAIASAMPPMMLPRYFPDVRAALWPLIPVVLGVGSYVLGMLTSPSMTPQAIARISPLLQVYPLDWIVAGMGGALLGAWYSERSREHHAFDLLCDFGPAGEDSCNAAILDG